MRDRSLSCGAAFIAGAVALLAVEMAVQFAHPNENGTNHSSIHHAGTLGAYLIAVDGPDLKPGDVFSDANVIRWAQWIDLSRTVQVPSGADDLGFLYCSYSLEVFDPVKCNVHRKVK